MRYMLLTLAIAVGMAVLASGVAVADTVTTNLESFNLGTVNGQGGWHSAQRLPDDPPPVIPALPFGYDQDVVAVNGIPGFGTKSLRHSNAFNEPTGEFFFQTYSSSTAESAGESEPNTEYTGVFSFTSDKPDAQQEGLFMTMSPDNSTGGRMSAVRLIDEPDGIRAIIFDTPDPSGGFVAYDGGLYKRDAVHTVKFWIKFVPGENNDIVRIFIDGRDIGNELGVCFTTWENFYRATGQAVPVTNSIQFRASGGQVPDLIGAGFLFDNVTNTTANGRGPLGCGEEPPPDVDKTTQTRSALRGDLITYRITVRNRGRAPLRDVRVCDRVPRALRFVGASIRLHRAGHRRLCLTLRLLRPGRPRTFRATFALRMNVSADTVTNDATVDTPTGSTPSPSVPESGTAPKERRRRVGRDAAKIRVRAEPSACPAARRPRAHAAC